MYDFSAFCQLHPELKGCQPSLERAVEAIVNAVKGGGKLLLAGSGGSAADCEHIAGELLKEFRIHRRRDPFFDDAFSRMFPDDGALLKALAPGIPAVSLTGGVAINTALLNDVGAEVLFAQKLYALARPQDVFLAVSTSGNSAMLIAALKVAKVLGVKTIALTGDGGGKMKNFCDILITVPQKETYLVQELHLPVYHQLCAAVEEELFG